MAVLLVIVFSLATTGYNCYELISDRFTAVSDIISYRYRGFRSYEVHLKPPPRLRGGGWGWGSCTS
ncbi:MAG: hypothetical protein ACK57R_16960 [Dolichospermum sp.]